MVLRKPYAFIIKHFKLLHLALLGCLIFVLITMNDINNLFESLQRSNTLMYAGANVYVNNIVYLFLLIILGLAGVIFWILRVKKKPTALYLFLIIYAVALLPVYAYLFSLLTHMIDEITNLDTIILAKDISMIATWPSYVFIAICFIRGIGFNLKQFNFSKDLKELQIDEKDNEEVEVTFGQNNYKYFRFIRRTIRECKYYILENKFAIACIGGLLTIVLVIVGINYYNEYMKVLAASEATSVNGIAYTVRKSYVTTRDSNGETIKPGYKYVVVDMSFHNLTNSNKAVDLDLITLANGKLSYHPIMTKNEKFYDLGVYYNRGDVLEADETMDAVIAFELPGGARTNDLKLRVRYAIENKTKSVISRYRLFDVNPRNIDSKVEKNNYNVNEIMRINPVGINRFDLKITGYKVLDIYDNKYVLCSSLDKCMPLSNVITPNQKELYTMLEIDYDSTLYEDNKFRKTLNTYNKIFEHYLVINYEILGRKYSTNAKTIAKSDVDNKLFVLVDRKITNATDINLEFNFRNDVYNVTLLGD